MFWIIVGFLIIVACAIRVLLRPNRTPEARVAWLAVIFALPGLGVLAYLLLGETSIGAKRTERIKRVTADLERPETLQGWPALDPSPQMKPLFAVGESITGYPPVAGNSGELMADSDATIARMVADIDAAQRHVHLMFYIWLCVVSHYQILVEVQSMGSDKVKVLQEQDQLFILFHIL